MASLDFGSKVCMQAHPSHSTWCAESKPEVHQELSLGEVLHLVPGDVVDGDALVAIALQAAVDVEQQVHVIIPAVKKALRSNL